VADLRYQPVPHDHATFIEKARERRGFGQAYADLGKEFALAAELLRARSRSGLTQEAVAERMGTSKSAVSRLETAGKHSPSVTTLRRYAEAVGCDIEIKLVPAPRAPRPPKAHSRVHR
jgi:DNA-binding XRE family transcriptional regulator